MHSLIDELVLASAYSLFSRKINEQIMYTSINHSFSPGGGGGGRGFLVNCIPMCE